MNITNVTHAITAQDHSLNDTTGLVENLVNGTVLAVLSDPYVWHTLSSMAQTLTESAKGFFYGLVNGAASKEVPVVRARIGAHRCRDTPPLYPKVPANIAENLRFDASAINDEDRCLSAEAYYSRLPIISKFLNSEGQGDIDTVNEEGAFSLMALPDTTKRDVFMAYTHALTQLYSNKKYKALHCTCENVYVHLSNNFEIRRVIFTSPNFPDPVFSAQRQLVIIKCPSDVRKTATIKSCMRGSFSPNEYEHIFWKLNKTLESIVVRAPTFEHLEKEEKTRIFNFFGKELEQETKKSTTLVTEKMRISGDDAVKGTGRITIIIERVSKILSRRGFPMSRGAEMSLEEIQDQVKEVLIIELPRDAIHELDS